VDLIHVAVNGTTVATLSLTAGQTTSTTAIDVDISLSAGDLLTVARLAADGGACQVQIDR
jgi:type II secretory pathway component PulM